MCVDTSIPVPAVCSAGWIHNKKKLTLSCAADISGDLGIRISHSHQNGAVGEQTLQRETDTYLIGVFTSHLCYRKDQCILQHGVTTQRHLHWSPNGLRLTSGVGVTTHTTLFTSFQASPIRVADKSSVVLVAALPPLLSDISIMTPQSLFETALWCLCCALRPPAPINPHLSSLSLSTQPGDAHKLFSCSWENKFGLCKCTKSLYRECSGPERCPEITSVIILALYEWNLIELRAFIGTRNEKTTGTGPTKRDLSSSGFRKVC